MKNVQVDRLFHPYVLCFRSAAEGSQCEEIKRYGSELADENISQIGRDYARVTEKGRGTIEFWRDGEPQPRYREPYP